jgi:hypothetical protein
MESLFIVNPRRKKRKGRMPAGLRRYWAARRGRKTRKSRRRAVMTNPRRRRRVHHVAARRRIRRNPHRRYAKHRRRARNPIFRRRARRRHHNPFSTSGLMSVLKPAGIGAAGAIATAIAYGYLSPQLPASLTTGYLPLLVKAAAAVGLGYLIGKFSSRQDGQYATVGGLTVVLVGAVTPLITQAAPTLPGLSGLAGYGDYIPHRPMGAYSSTLRRGQQSRLGFISPAPRLGAYSPTLGRGGAGAGAGMSGSGFDGLNDGM